MILRNFPKKEGTTFDYCNSTGKEWILFSWCTISPSPVQTRAGTSMWCIPSQSYVHVITDGGTLYWFADYRILLQQSTVLSPWIIYLKPLDLLLRGNFFPAWSWRNIVNRHCWDNSFFHHILRLHFCQPCLRFFIRIPVEAKKSLLD